MNPEAVVQETHRALTEVGGKLLLRRPNGARSTTFTDIFVTGRIINADSDPVLGDGIDQTSRIAIISPVEIRANKWPAPPRDGDRLVDELGHHFTVESVNILRIGNVAVRYELWIKG